MPIRNCSEITCAIEVINKSRCISYFCTVPKQIEEKKYKTALIAEGFAPEQIRKYGFAFRGRECLIG